MELKIQCACGAKYAFEVEPVNGRVPCELRCPNCNASWTEAANAQLAETLPQAAPATAQPTPLGLRVTKPVHLAESAETPAVPPSPRPIPMATRFAPPPAEESNYGRFLLGIGGALMGAAIGAAVYFTVFKFTDKKIKLLAIGVGFLAGLGARLLGKEGSKELGAITGALVLCSIFGAQYMMGKAEIDDALDPGSLFKEQVEYAKDVVKAVPNGSEQEIRVYLAKEEYDEKDPAAVPASAVRELKGELPRLRELASGTMTQEQYMSRILDGTEVYEERLAYAKEALAAIPTGSDQEIRAFLVKQYEEDGEKVKPNDIDAEEIQELKEDLPELKDLVSGKITKEKYAVRELEEDKKAEGEKEEKFEESGAYKMLLLAMSLSWFNIVCMVAGVGLAYRMSTDA